VGVDKFYADTFKGFENYLTHKPDLAKQINEGLMIASAIAYASDWEVKPVQVVEEPPEVVRYRPVYDIFDLE